MQWLVDVAEETGNRDIRTVVQVSFGNKRCCEGKSGLSDLSVQARAFA